MGHTYMHTHYCEECETPFDSVKYDARYCSSTCRSKAHRFKQERAKAQQKAKDAIIALGRYCGNDETRGLMIELQHRLALMVNEGEIRAALR